MKNILAAAAIFETLTVNFSELYKTKEIAYTPFGHPSVGTVFCWAALCSIFSIYAEIELMNLFLDDRDGL